MCRILRIPPTFTDRSQTNKVRDQTHQCDVDISKLSETQKIQNLKLFEQILREPEDQCDQNLIGWLKESKAFIMPSDRYRLQKSLGNPISFGSCYLLIRAVPTSRLLVPWGQQPPALQSKSKEHMHGSRGLPWAVFAVIKPGSFIGAGQKRSSEDLQLRKDNLKASLSPIFIVQLPIAWGAVVVATSGSLMNSKTHEFVELSMALFSWAYTHGSCEYLWKTCVGVFFLPPISWSGKAEVQISHTELQKQKIARQLLEVQLCIYVNDSWKGTI